jgi:glycosyltransferase involved in cell wall biosynthesis
LLATIFYGGNNILHDYFNRWNVALAINPSSPYDVPLETPVRKRRRRKTAIRQTGSGRPVVLQVLPRLVSGGVERGTLEIARALKTAGGTPIVASGGGPMVRDLRRAGIMHIELPLFSKNPFVMWKNIRQLEKIIIENGVDIVHARSRAPAWSAWAAARRTDCRFVTTFHAAYKFSSKKIFFAAKKFYNAVMARGDRVIAISHFIAEYIHEFYQVAPDRVRLIPRGVDINDFHPDRVGPGRTAVLRRAWQVNDARPIIMMPGRISRWKGQRELIEAIAMIGRNDISVLIVGGVDGKDRYQAELVETVARHQLESVVKFVGRCDDMPAAYSVADIIVSASYDPEGFGRVVVEAMAMEKPVIVADHGASPELVQPGETGWIVPPRDVEALSACLIDALNMAPAKRAEMGQRAQRRVHADFTLDLMCQRTLAVYDELLAPRLIMTLSE